MRSIYDATTRLVATVLLLTHGGLSHGALMADAPRPVILEAFDAVMALPAGQPKDQLLRDIGRELASSGRIEEAKAAATAIGYINGRPLLQRAIALRQATDGDLAAALRTVGEIDAPQLPDSRDQAISAVAVVRAEAGDMGGVLKAILSISRPEMRANALGIVMRARAEAGDVEWALSLASKFPPGMQAQGLTGVARVMAEHGDTEAAVGLTQRESASTPAIFLAIAQGREKAGDLEGAAGFAGRIIGKDVDWGMEGKAKVIVIRDLAARGEIARAREAAALPWKKPAITPQNRRSPPSTDAFERDAARAIAKGAAASGDVAGARSDLPRFPVHSRVMALVGIADELEKAGQRPVAERLVTVAEKEAVDGLGFYYGELGAAQYRLGRIEASRESIDKAMHAKEIGTPVNQRVIVAAQGRAGDLEGAKATIETISEPDLRDQARAWLAGILAKQGRAELALDAAHAIADRLQRAATLAHLGKAFAGSGDRVRAVGTCREAVGVIGDEQPPAEVARIITHGWASTPEEVASASAWARGLKGDEARAAALLGVVEGELGRPIWLAVSPYSIPGLEPFTGQASEN